ncbi:MAG: gliding motility-associated C-terminal domain-containing protein [Flavobacteriaceae bacterium]|nr:gliding motility-associated C-terminal domain-containing protein [Flavobacteriaceae bacterium]
MRKNIIFTIFLTVFCFCIGVAQQGSTIPKVLEYCEGDEIVLTSETANAYEWSKKDGTKIGTTQDLDLGNAEKSKEGIYTLKVTDGNNCSNTTKVKIVVNALPTFTDTNTEICVGGEITVVGSGTKATSNAYVSSDTTVATVDIEGKVTGVSSGSTEITYTNDKGCVVKKMITVNAKPIVENVAVDCLSGVGEGKLTVSPTGTGYKYSLDGGAYQSSNIFTQVSNGNHIVKVQNSSGCESEGKTIAVQCGCTTPPIVTLSNKLGSVCGIMSKTVTDNTFVNANKVTVSHNGSGTLSASEFTTSPFSFTYTPVNDDLGKEVSIIFTTDNPKGSPCVSSEVTYKLKVNALPTFTDTNTEVCVGGEITVVGSGTKATSNAYVSSDTTVATVDIEGKVTGVSSGSAEITYTNDKGCVVKKTIIVKDKPIAVLVASKTTICSKEEVIFTAGGGDMYEFYVNENKKQVKSTKKTFKTTDLADGDKIKVKVWNTSSCMVESDAVIINVDKNCDENIPTLVDNVVQHTLCRGKEVIFTAGKGDEFEFYINNRVVQTKSTQKTFTTSTLNNGDKVRVKVWKGGVVFESKDIAMIVNELPRPTIDVVNNLCVGKTIKFVAGGGEKYEFYINNKLVQSKSKQHTYSTSALHKGDNTITIKVWNANDCVDDLDQVITIKDCNTDDKKSIEALLTVSKSIICEGEEITFTASGGKQYEFFINGISKQGKSDSNIFTTSNLRNADKITVRAWDNSVTDDSSEVVITVNALPNVTLFEVKNALIDYQETGLFRIVGTPNARVIYQINGIENEVSLTQKGDITIEIPNVVKKQVIELKTITLNDCERAINMMKEITIYEKADAGEDGKLQAINGIEPTEEELFNSLGGTPQKGGVWTKEGDKYIYTVTSASGDVDTAQVIIYDTLYSKNKTKINNSFSPNGDSINDTWVIFKDLPLNYPNNRLRVFNRWGSKVYEVKPYRNDWDASFNNGKLPQGTYFYILDLNDSQKTRIVGWVYINLNGK